MKILDARNLFRSNLIDLTLKFSFLKYNLIMKCNFERETNNTKSETTCPFATAWSDVHVENFKENQ
jgi:hypothetical protein